MNENNSDGNNEIISKLREDLAQLDATLADNHGLKEKIAALLETYTSDDLWPGNIREFERSLDLLIPSLSGVFKNCLLNAMALLEEHPEMLPSTLKEFIQEIQNKYGHKYRTGIYRTTMTYDGANWYSVNVQAFPKNNVQWYGITVFRNDGETLYFEGSDRSLGNLMGIIQGAMDQSKGVKQDTESKEAQIR